MGAALILLLVALFLFAGMMLMDAALDRLTAAVNAAVAKLTAPVPTNDDKLTELAVALETATGEAPAEPTAG